MSLNVKVEFGESTLGVPYRRVVIEDKGSVTHYNALDFRLSRRLVGNVSELDNGIFSKESTFKFTSEGKSSSLIHFGNALDMYSVGSAPLLLEAIKKRLDIVRDVVAKEFYQITDEASCTITPVIKELQRAAYAMSILFEG